MENISNEKKDSRKMTFTNYKRIQIGLIIGICIAAIIMIWAYVSFIGTDNQPATETQATVKEEAAQEKEKLTPYEKSRRKIPLTEQEKKELAKELSGDFSKLNMKPVEDKGF